MKNTNGGIDWAKRDPWLKELIAEIEKGKYSTVVYTTGWFTVCTGAE